MRPADFWSVGLTRPLKAGDTLHLHLPASCTILAEGRTWTPSGLVTLTCIGWRARYMTRREASVATIGVDAVRQRRFKCLREYVECRRRSSSFEGPVGRPR